MTQDNSYDNRPERPAHVPVTHVEFNDASTDNYGAIVAIAMLAILIGGVIIYLVS